MSPSSDGYRFEDALAEMVFGACVSSCLSIQGNSCSKPVSLFSSYQVFSALFRLSGDSDFSSCVFFSVPISIREVLSHEK